MKTLIWKEFREHVRWLPIGLVVVTIIAWIATPGRGATQALVARDLVNWLAIILPLLAFALGVVQSYRDLQPAAGDYLNHRSVTASDVFLAKAVAGFAIYAAAVVPPLLALAAWMTWQGLDWYPMRPAQVLPALVYALFAFLLHPAATMMMVHNGSWWTTRWLPLVPAVTILLPVAVALGVGGLRGAVLALPVALIVLAWLMAVARQSWRDLRADPPAADMNDRLRGRWLLPTYLLIGSLVTVIAAWSVGAMVSESPRSLSESFVPYNQLAVHTTTDEPWLVTCTQQWDESETEVETKTVAGDAIRPDRPVNPLASLGDDDAFQNLVRLGRLDEGSQPDGFFTTLRSLDGSYRITFAYDQRGYLLGYGGRPRRWQRTVAADGIYPAGRLAGEPFTVDPTSTAFQVFSPLSQAGYQLPLIDSQGVYVLENKPPTIRRIIDADIEAAVMFETEDDHAPRLLLRNAATLSEYRLLDASGSETWYEKPGDDDAAPPHLSRPLTDLQLSAQLVRSVDIPPPLLSQPRLVVAATADGYVMAADHGSRRVFSITAEGDFEMTDFQVVPGTISPPPDDRVRLWTLLPTLLPGIVFVIAGAGSLWDSGGNARWTGFREMISQQPVQTTAVVVAFAIVLLGSLVLTARAARTRDLRRGQTLTWCLSVLFFGLAAPLAVLAIYRRAHREPCPQCDKQRRVDRRTCSHCGAEWEPPPKEGIEITDKSEPVRSMESAL